MSADVEAQIAQTLASIDQTMKAQTELLKRITTHLEALGAAARTYVQKNGPLGR